MGFTKLLLVIRIQPPVFFQNKRAGICHLHTGARDTAVTAAASPQCSQDSSDARGAKYPQGFPCMPPSLQTAVCNGWATELVEPILWMVSGEGGETRLLIQRS